MDVRASLHVAIARECIWIAPLFCVALIALGLLRPLPKIQPPAHYRVVVDSGGTAVKIALPFRGVALATNSFPSSYLEDTRSPESLVYAGKPSDREWFAKSALSWIYPRVLHNEAIWNTRLFQNSSSPFTEIETLLAYDSSVYLGCGGPPDLVRRVGLPVFNCGGSPALRQRLGLPDLKSDVGCGRPPDSMRDRYPQAYLNGGYYSESYLFPPLRLLSALINHPEAAQPRIASYCTAIAALRQELDPATLTSRPRVEAAGEDKGNLARAGMIDVDAERKIPGDDGERMLIRDPDTILLANGPPKEFEEDPRWQGLKAVRNKRVYRRPFLVEWWATGLTFKPIEIRWMAEVAHPERLQPKVRELLRDRVQSEFGYHLSDDQIDNILHVSENSGSVGGEAFYPRGASHL